MDIKLRAKLSAYSRVSELISNSTTKLPEIGENDNGKVVGVDNGNYTLFPTIQKPDIDTLFEKKSEDETVTKEEIDTLFPEKDVADSVTKGQIDTLFNNHEVETDSPSTPNTNSYGTVSFAEIDSLFN